VKKTSRIRVKEKPLSCGSDGFRGSDNRRYFSCPTGPARSQFFTPPDSILDLVKGWFKAQHNREKAGQLQQKHRQ
jgi:hypothetical protein